MLIENVQEPLGALEAGEERELLADATHLHLLFTGGELFCLFVEDTVSIFYALVCHRFVFFFLLVGDTIISLYFLRLRLAK